MLYVLAKFKYTPTTVETGKDKTSKNPFMEKVAAMLKAELVLPVDLACRNLWNFYALNHYDGELFDQFGALIVKNHDKLSEIDIANALRAFAYFKHTGTE